MCGRIYIKATLEEMLQNFAFAGRGGVGSLSNQFPRYNGAPSLYYPIIIRDMVLAPGIDDISARRWVYLANARE